MRWHWRRPTPPRPGRREAERSHRPATIGRMRDPFANIGAHRIVFTMLIGVLALLAFAVLRPFIVPIAWATIMVYTTWPLHLRVRRALGGRATLAASVMTLGLSTAIVLPLLWLLATLQVELTAAYQALSDWLAQGPREVPGLFFAIPGLGDWLQRWLDELTRAPGALQQQIGEWTRQGGGELLDLLGGVGRNAAKLGFALITALFLYRDGDTLLDQLREVLKRLVGSRIVGYLVATGTTTKAVVYGLFLAALGQGALATLGYWGAGVDAPMTLGVLTAMVALVPWGAPMVWVTVGVWLLMTGKTAAGIGLLLWGMLAVSWIDNLLRPLVISSASRTPFLLVMFGVLGGAAAFGLIGLFVGPVILAIAMAIWREWIGQGAPPGDEKADSTITGDAL